MNLLEWHMWYKFEIYETVKNKISAGTKAITSTMYNSYVAPYVPSIAQKGLDLLGAYCGFLFTPPYQDARKSLVGMFVGKKDANLQQVLGFDAELVKTEYSKLIKGFRYALTNMLNGQKIPNHELGSRWRVYVIPLAEFMDSVVDPQKSFAYVDKNINVINLPELRFSEELIRIYFDKIDNDQVFQDLDNAASPKWVIRIKKIWNLLFLIEKILNAIETNPHQIHTQELLSDINHAYTLLFELDIDIFAVFEKYTEKLTQISKGALQGQATTIDELSIAKDLGYYLGLSLSQLGSSGNVGSFIFQSIEFSPHLLAKITSVLQQMVDLATQKGSLSLELKNIEEINQEAKKIKGDIENFFQIQLQGKGNYFQVIIDIIELCNNSQEVNLRKFLNYIGNEHQALSKEFLRLVKYELIPSLLGVIEEFENAMLLEPGSMVFYFEGMAQSYYGALVASLKYNPDDDLGRLYSAHWMKIREYNGLKRLSLLLQQESAVESKLLLLGMTHVLKNLSIEEFEKIKAKVLQIATLEYSSLQEKFRSLNVSNYQFCVFDQTQANLLVNGLREDSRWIAKLIAKDMTYSEFEQLRDNILSFTETPESLKSKLRLLNADNFRQVEFDRHELSFLQQKKQADNNLVAKLVLVSREVKPLEQFKNLYDYFVMADSLAAESIRKSQLVSGPQWDSIRLKVSVILQAEFLQFQNQISFLRTYIADFESAQHQRIAYFELPVDFEIKMETLSEETQAAIRAAPLEDHEGLLKQALILEKKRQLAQHIRAQKYQDFIIGHVAVVYFLDEYFIVPKNPHEPIEVIDSICTPMKPLKNSAIILPGRTVQQLGYDTRLDTYLIPLSQELPRFSLDLSQEHVTLDQLTLKELNAYQIELFEQAEKIKIAKMHLSKLRFAFENQGRPESLNQLLHAYYNLQGVFQYFLGEDRFMIFNSQVIGKQFRAMTSGKIASLESFLDRKMAESGRVMHAVGQEIQKKLVSEKQEQYKKITEDKRAGYLLHHTRYSSFFRDAIEKLKNYVEQYGSRSLKQALIQAQKTVSGPAVIYDTHQLFNVDKINQKGFEICYAHNCLFYLEQLYLGFEQQKRYDVNNTKAISEIMIRVNSIGDLLQFIDFSLGQKPRTALLKSFNQVFHYQTALQTFRRYSRIYGIRDIQASPLLTTTLIAHKAITDVFEKPEIRDYIFRGALSHEVQRRTDALMANPQFILTQFHEAQKISIYKSYREEIALLRTRIFVQSVELKTLSRLLETNKTPFKAIQYAIQNKLMHQLTKKLAQKEMEFDLILENRNQLFFRIMEKKRQKRTSELSDVEGIILKLMSSKELSSLDKSLIERTRQKNLKLIRQRSMLKTYYQELGEKNTQIKKVLKPLHAQYTAIIQKLKRDSASVTLSELLIKDAYEQARSPKRLKLNAAKMTGLRDIFQKAEGALSSEERAVKELYKQNASGEFEFCNQGLSDEEVLFKKTYFRYISGYPFEMTPKDKRLIDGVLAKPPLARTTQEVNLIKFIEVQESKGERKYALVSYQSDFEEDLLLELHQKRIHCGFVRWSELSDEDLLKFPQIVNIFLRSDIQQLYLNFQGQVNEQNFEKLMAAIKVAVSGTLQEFELLDYRVKELKRLHLGNPQIINDYTLMNQGSSLFGIRIIKVYSILLSRLRQSLVELRKNSASRVGDLREYIITPFLTNIDQFEVELGLKPGLLANLIEKQLLAFSYEFSGELSASPLNIPRRLKDEKTSLQTRRKAILALPDAAENLEILDRRHQLALEEEELKFKALIFDTFKKSAREYCHLLKTEFKFLSDEQALKVIANFMEKEIIRQVGSQTNPSELKDDIYQEIKRQDDTGHEVQFPTDLVYKSHLSIYVSEYMQDKQHELKKVNDLFKTLNEYQAYLEGIQKDLKRLENELTKTTETWAAYFYKFGIHIEYFFKIKVYYASLTHDLIGEKLAQISVLKTKLNETFEDVTELTSAFKDTLRGAYLNQKLVSSKKSSWYPTYYIFSLMYYLIKCVISLINVFYPKIRVMDEFQRYNAQLIETLDLKAKDVKLDVRATLDTFFSSPTEHSSSTREALRRK
jgi:hypothetical protein